MTQRNLVNRHANAESPGRFGSGVPAVPRCLACGEAVPPPFSVCFQCGGSPFYADPHGADFSVLVDPVPSMRLRSDVARVVAELSPGLDRTAVELQLTEGQPAVWVAGGLSEPAAQALVERFRAMKAPARLVRGEPEHPSAMRTAAHPLSLGLVAVGLVVGFFVEWWVGLALIAAGIALGALRARRGSTVVALAVPPLAPDAPRELQEAVLRIVAARKQLQGQAEASIAGIIDHARAVFSRLGDESDNVGFIAGGLEGAVGQGARVLLAAASVLAERAQGNTQAVAALEAVRDTFTDVSRDLAALAANPDAEQDIAARLQRNAARLQQGAQAGALLGSGS